MRFLWLTMLMVATFASLSAAGPPDYAAAGMTTCEHRDLDTWYPRVQVFAKSDFMPVDAGTYDLSFGPNAKVHDFYGEAGSKLLSFRGSTREYAYIDKDGRCFVLGADGGFFPSYPNICMAVGEGFRR